MSRAIRNLWVGKTDDSAIPPRVKIRIFLLANKRCQNCKRPIAGKLTPEYDHVIALINGGENAESNLQLLCCECHGQKTKIDLAEKSVTARVRAKHLGIKKPRTIRSWRKFNGDIVHAGRDRS